MPAKMPRKEFAHAPIIRRVQGSGFYIVNSFPGRSSRGHYYLYTDGKIRDGAVFRGPCFALEPPTAFWADRVAAVRFLMKWGDHYDVRILVSDPSRGVKQLSR